MMKKKLVVVRDFLVPAIKEKQNREQILLFNEEMLEKNNYDFNQIKDYPYKKLSEEEKQLVRSILFGPDAPIELAYFIQELYKHTEIENLESFAKVNMQSLKLFKYKRKFFSNTVGYYSSVHNEMHYSDLDSKYHEALHAVSSVFIKKIINGVTFVCSKSGFCCNTINTTFGKGINEGFTEMLTRKIFFDEDYSINRYRANMAGARLLELFYDDPSLMERDYFQNNHNGPIMNFMRYGTAEEFKKFSNYMDFMALTSIKNHEDLLMLKLFKNILERTENEKMKDAADEIIEGYLENSKQTIK